MRKYLATLPDKPDRYKRRFALLASGSFTIFIFVVWSLVNFGIPQNGGELAQNNTGAEQESTSPFESLGNGVATAFKALVGGFGEIKEDLMQVDIDVEGEYQEMRGRALDTYGRPR